MSYHNEEFPQYVKTAGKITVLTAIIGMFVFIAAFVVDFGTQELQKVTAQQATTTLTVLNTPPEFTIETYEAIESSVTNPTNSGDDIRWEAVGTDSNGAPYFLLICSTNATPTPNAAADLGSLGTAAPECGVGAIQWGVSTSTISGELSFVATTTTETTPFDESNDWYSWVCDDDPANPRCNIMPSQGVVATGSSPFVVNSRPVLTLAVNDGPVDPGDILSFLSSSTDPDIEGGEDNIFITVCSSNTTYDTDTNTCVDSIASSTVGVTADASATRTIGIPTRDQVYSAYAYIYDQHGHEATANPIDVAFEVANVAPFVLGGEIELFGAAGTGTDLIVSVPGGETPSSTLNFTVQDNNSCLNAASTSEIVGYDFSVFRSGVGTTTCDTSSASYNPNNCYPSGVGQVVWEYTCTQISTCSGATQTDLDFSCDFPLWFVADPTDNGANTPAFLEVQNWTAAVRGIDDDSAVGLLATTSNPRELISFSAIDILAQNIAYESIEPGANTGAINASSTALNVGNTGLDQEVLGEDMCDDFAPGNECEASATSTIPADQQEFSTTTFSYGNGSNISSTTPAEAELNILKTTATSSDQWQQGITYWGIAVPASVTLAGSYTGLNTFTAVTAEAIDWQ